MAGDIDLKQLHAQITGQPLNLQQRLALAGPGEIVPYEPWELRDMPQVLDLRQPVSHTHDPETSHAAERSITASGARKTHNEHVAWLVARWPGKTASELAALELAHFPQNPLDLIEIRRRLSDMHHIHMRQGEARLGLLAKREVTWFPK